MAKKQKKLYREQEEKLDEEQDVITCESCKEQVNYGDCDSVGACSGYIFCANCEKEISSNGEMHYWSNCVDCLLTSAMDLTDDWRLHAAEIARKRG